MLFKQYLNQTDFSTIQYIPCPNEVYNTFISLYKKCLRKPTSININNYKMYVNLYIKLKRKNENIALATLVPQFPLLYLVVYSTLLLHQLIHRP